MTARCTVQARGNVEAWLSQVEQSMAVCLRKLARAGHQTFPNQPRTQWVTQHPSQLVLLISQVQSHLLLIATQIFCSQDMHMSGSVNHRAHNIREHRWTRFWCVALVEQFVHLQLAYTSCSFLGKLLGQQPLQETGALQVLFLSVVA